LPDRLSRHRPDWVRVAVNGRFIQIPELEHTVLRGFQRTLPRHRYPVGIVHLQVDPKDIDWNRHPAKTEVYLHHLQTWQERISSLITNLLKAPEPRISLAVTEMLRTAETKAIYKTAIPKLKVLAQVHNTYILAEREGGLCLIEQHVADERVLFEHIEQQWEIVALAQPLIARDLSDQVVDNLKTLGIDIEEFGIEMWAVRSLPRIIIERVGDRPEILLEILVELGGDISQAKATAACRSAVRNGTTLDLTTMQNLVNKWEQTRNPHTCPHGRPICLSLESSDLARFFRRNWIIGN
jgi:DNA mismatch repair protein MutL